MSNTITYDTFLSKSCNLSLSNESRRRNWTLSQLIGICNQLNLGASGSNKQLCAKIFKYFFIKIKENPELASPQSYNVILSQGNINDSILSGILTGIFGLPRFIPNTFYYNEVKAITDILDSQSIQQLSQTTLIKFAMLIMCIKLQVLRIPDELAIETVTNQLPPRISSLSTEHQHRVSPSTPSTPSTPMPMSMPMPMPMSIPANRQGMYTQHRPRVSSLNTSRQAMYIPSEILEEDSMDFSDTNSDSESISDNIEGCVNESVISLEPFDIKSNDIFTMYYLNNSNKFANGTCVSKSEMKHYIESEEDDSPSLFTTIWKGGDKTGIGGKPTCKFIVKMPPNNIWITLGSFDKMMNLNEKNWYLLPLYSNKRRRIGFQYGVGRNHGQIPGSIIYKAFTKQEIKNNVKVIETIYDYPLYLADLTLSQLDNSTNIIRSIKNQFL